MIKAPDTAVVGIGYWGKNLARNFYELNVLKTICDHDSSKSESVKRKYPGVDFTANFDEVLQDPTIKHVVIATPTNSHYTLAKKALSFKKDVFVEKAMCSSADEALELVNLAQANDCILMVGHLLHYHPAVEKIKEMLDEKIIGDIYHLSFNRLNFGSVGAETSALWAFAPHDISLLLSMTHGRKIIGCSSINRCFFSHHFMDQTWIHLEFEKGVSSDIHVGWAHPHPERNFCIKGEKGMIFFDDLKPWDEKICLSLSQISASDQKIVFIPEDKAYVTLIQDEPLKKECLHFLNCCKTRTEPLTNGYEGLNVLKLLEKIKNFDEMRNPSLI